MLNRKNALITGSQPVAAYFAVAVLLLNVHSCLTRKNQISDRYKVFLPTLHEYLALKDENFDSASKLDI
jgi:hypothetical protein